MRTLDRYIVRQFLSSVVLCLVVLLGLRIVADIFVNIQDFTRRSVQSSGFMDVAGEIAIYYAYHSLQYFRELGGVIIVAAAAFTLARMNQANELTAMLASGVSLHRVLLPMVLCCVGMNMLIIVDSESVIPRFKYELALSRGDSGGLESRRVPGVPDNQSSVWYAKRLLQSESRLQYPLIIMRDAQGRSAGRLTAPMGLYDRDSKNWRFEALNADCPVPHLLPDGSPDTKRPRSLKTPQAENVVRFYEGRWIGFCSEKCARQWDAMDDSRRSALAAGGTQNIPALHNVPGWRQSATTLFVPSSLGPQEMLTAARNMPENAGVDWRKADSAMVSAQDNESRMVISAERLVLQNKDGRGAAGELRGNVRFELLRGEQPLAAVVADRAVYKADAVQSGWRLEGGRIEYTCDLNSPDMALRQSTDWLSYMSTSELTRLLRLGRLPDASGAMLARHTRFADFFNNLILLLVGVPFILSRERNIKASAFLTVLMVGSVFAFIYLARYLNLQPSLAAWLPILVFGPVAAAMVHAVKT